MIRKGYERVQKLDCRTLIEELAAKMPDRNLKYYAVTLTSTNESRFFCSIFSMWVGHADKHRRIEIRKASLVNAENVVARRREAGERCLVINNSSDLQIFLLSGGHAVIAEELAKLEVSDWLEPEQVVEYGPAGFTSIKTLPKCFMNRAPSPRLRMQVLKRDGYSCRICGRRPENNTDIELHVHHIRPWADGGVTAERNLITLCHTCHDGLSPHYELALYYMVEQPNAAHSTEHNRSIRHYNSNLFSRELHTNK
jgi:hypothetical protein